MPYHYPIYNLVSDTDLARDPNFGARDGFTQDIRVGTSAKNSHTLGTIEVRRVSGPEKTVDFHLLINGKEIAHGILTGKAFELRPVTDLRGEA